MTLGNSSLESFGRFLRGGVYYESDSEGWRGWEGRRGASTPVLVNTWACIV